MSSITLVINSRGFLSYKTADEYLGVLGEFFVTDISYMPVFARALFESDDNDIYQLKTCGLVVQKDTCALRLLEQSQERMVVFSKQELFGIIKRWEDAVIAADRRYFVKELHCNDMHYRVVNGVLFNKKLSTEISLS